MQTPKTNKKESNCRWLEAYEAKLLKLNVCSFSAQIHQFVVVRNFFSSFFRFDDTSHASTTTSAM